MTTRNKGFAWNMKILYITNVPSPYRVDFFNEIGKSTDLTVLFEKGSSSERNSEWKKYRFINFKGIILKGKDISADKAVCFDVLNYLKQRWDKIVVTDVSSLTGMIAIQYMKMKHIKYWIEGDGGFAKDGKGLKERIKKHFISGAEGYFSTSDEHDRYYLTYGAEKDRIYRYPFTSISQRYLESAQSPFDKKQIKEMLCITEEKVVLTVGQFIERKGFDILLKTAINLPRNTGVYFVGGEPTKEYLEIESNYNLKNVHFVGFVKSDQLMDYYRVADIFVLPTREDIWGLVVNEAMAFSLPIITTNRCIAGLQLIKENENGFIIDVDSVSQLHETIELLCKNDELREKFGDKSLSIISEYTIEKMARNHKEILTKHSNSRSI